MFLRAVGVVHGVSKGVRQAFELFRVCPISHPRRHN